LDWYLSDTYRIDGFKLPNYFLSRPEVYSSLARTFEG
jgi:hypothetical protein